MGVNFNSDSIMPSIVLCFSRRSPTEKSTWRPSILTGKLLEQERELRKARPLSTRSQRIIIKIAVIIIVMIITMMTVMKTIIMT